MEAFFALLPVWLPMIIFGGQWIWARAEDRRQDQYNEEQRRQAKGLPRHERCGCDECAQWRVVNIERLRT